MAQDDLGCVYAIRNLVTSVRYIGATQDPKRRWMTHRSDLRRGSHINRRLQADWDQYGESAFEFAVMSNHKTYSGRKRAEGRLIAWLFAECPALVYNGRASEIYMPNFRYCPTEHCQAITHHGTRCQFHARFGGYCLLHRAMRERNAA